MIEDLVPEVGSTVTNVLFNKNKTMAKLGFSDGKSIIMRIDSFIDTPMTQEIPRRSVSQPPKMESRNIPVIKKPSLSKPRQERIPETMAEFQQLMEASKRTINPETIGNLKDRSEDRSARLAAEFTSKTGGNADTVLAGLPTA